MSSYATRPLRKPPIVPSTSLTWAWSSSSTILQSISFFGPSKKPSSETWTKRITFVIAIHSPERIDHTQGLEGECRHILRVENVHASIKARRENEGVP